MEHYHNYDNLGLRHAAITMVLTFPLVFALVKTATAEHCIKNFAEFVCHYENFNNFVLGEHSDKSIMFEFQHFKFTTFIANHQIFNQLYFIELTLITL